MKVMLHIRAERRRLNKETRFIRHGVEVRQDKLCRFAKRNSIDDSFCLDGEGVSPCFATPPVPSTYHY